MSCYIRLRGLPWSVTHQEILDFLKNVNVVGGTKGIHMILSRWDGKNTGEAFVELVSAYDEKEAFKLNRLTIGHRYIEIFSATNEEVQNAMRSPGSVSSNVVKLRGLPFAITEDQIENFFDGLNLKRDREGILIVMDRRGRATGEAYVEFESVGDTELALLRNREKIGHRYIEIFRSSMSEMRRQFGNRPGPYDLKDRATIRNRDDFGSGHFNMVRDKGFVGDNHNAIGACHSGNVLGFSGFGIINSQGGYSQNDPGNSFDRPGNNNNNIGLVNNPTKGIFWSPDLHKNIRGQIVDNCQAFGANKESVNGNDDINFNDDFNRGNNRSRVGPGKNVSVQLGTFNFGSNNDVQNDNNVFCVHMRGLPYNTFENEVYQFFDPVRPSNVNIIFNSKGLHSGSADAYFCSYDHAQIAMKKHMEQIGSRYIELFFDGNSKNIRTEF